MSEEILSSRGSIDSEDTNGTADTAGNAVTENRSVSEAQNENGEDVQAEMQTEDGEQAAEEQVSEPFLTKVRNTAVSLYNNDKLRTVLTYIIPVFLFVYAVYVSVYYIFFASQGEFHSDCTDTLMWANASHESGSVFDPDFIYACFLPFGINLIMQPLISVFGVSLTTHHLGMFAYFLLLTVFLILALREMKFDIRHTLVAAAVFLAVTFSSPKMREIFWGHTIYYTLGILFIAIGCFLYFRLLNLKEKLANAEQESKNKLRVHYFITLAVLCIFIMLTATDGISALSIFGLPFLAGIFAEQLLNSKSPIISKKSMQTYITAGVFLVMIYIGGKILAYFQGDLIAGYADAYSHFSDMGTWVDNFHTIPMSWLKLFGVVTMTDKKMSDPEGITNMIRIIAAGIIAVLPVIATCFYSKYKHDLKGRAIRIFIWLHWAASALVFSGVVFGLLSGAEWRLVPMLGTALILSLMFVLYAVSEKLSGARVSVLLAIPVIALSYMNFKDVTDMPSDNYKNNVLFAISDCLQDNGLTYGYATFWNANAITVISGSKVKVRDVTADTLSKRYYQSSTKWYEDQEGQKDYFLLLTDYEYNDLQEYVAPLEQRAVKKIDPYINNIPYHIFVFDSNIF